MSFEFTAQKLVYGGDALGHHQGRTILVPRVLPGERVEVEENRTAKGVTYARPLHVIAAAPERAVPPCPYFGECGGCQYQHLKYENQTIWKREILRETLRRIGKISWENEIPVHAAEPWNYRNQAQFKIVPSQGSVALGFYQAESHQLVAVNECRILSPRLNAALSELRGGEWSKDLTDCAEIEMMADDRDEHYMLTLRGRFARQQGAELAHKLLQHLPGLQTVGLKRESGYDTFGPPTLSYQVGNFCYQVSPGSFFQASRHLLPELVQAAAGGPSGKLVLDLYAGVGLFTLPLARAFEQVVGVEGNKRAAADLQANARMNDLHNVRAVCETTYDFLRRFARAGPDLAIIDPPRAGVGVPSLKLLGRIKPKRLHYVSCHPPTMARDLAALTQLGYRLISVEMFDFFPQTAHIECLTQLVMSGRAGS